MPASLSFNIISPTGPMDAYDAQVEASITRAFNAWTQHFDYTTGTVTVDINFSNLGTNVAADCMSVDWTRIGTDGDRAVQMPTTTEKLLGNTSPNDLVANAANLVIDVDSTWVQNTFASASNPAPKWQGDDQRVFEHEVGHGLGLSSFRTLSTDPLPVGYEESYDLNIRTSGTTVAFIGQNAQAVYGGPVPWDAQSMSHPLVPGQASVMSYLQPATSIQNLDVAMLQDCGVPVLNDDEVRQHEVVRLYTAAFGRQADMGGVVYWANDLGHGASLHDIAAGFLQSAEATATYGNLDSRGFVDAVYQNVLHRAADAGGEQYWMGVLNQGSGDRAGVLAGFSDSDENRANLNAQPNSSYATTPEEEVTRLYDAAFGRAPDPSGYEQWTTALINGKSLDFAAAGFISSPEYAARYGSAVSDKGFVDALYTNTLHRTADAAGENYWESLLSSGELTRANALVQFSDSAEHIASMAANVVAAAAAGQLTVPLGMMADPLPYHPLG